MNKYILLLSILIGSATVNASELQVERLTVPGESALRLNIWTPSDGGNGSLVLLSHGLGGRADGMRATAEAIANRGSIAIAVQHSSDNLFGSDRHMFAMENRGDELLQARAWALENLSVSENHIGLIGYSQGGLSVMIAAGVTPDRGLARVHCSANRADDRGFCGFASPWQGIADLLGLSKLFASSDNNFRDDREAVAFSAVAVAAPVAVFIPEEGLQKLSADVGIFSFAADTVLAPAFHSDYLHRALGDREHTYHSYPGVGHGALFGRLGEQINADIADFFATKL